MTMETTTSDGNSIEEIRLRRTQTLLGVWKLLTENGWLKAEHLKLSPYLLNESVEHYLTDMSILKTRYVIPDRIQPPKIAGLMTAAILRFRPVIPLVDECLSKYQMMANEILAVFNGVAICGEQAILEGDTSFIEEPWFDGWFNSFLYILHYRNYTPESLNFVYETLCYVKFPQSITKNTD